MAARRRWLGWIAGPGGVLIAIYSTKFLVLLISKLSSDENGHAVRTRWLEGVAGG